MLRREEYRGAARAIASYLAERQRPDGGFPGPDNYGVASALWLWSQFGAEFARQLDRAWNRLKESPPSTHGEFNTYALLHARERLGEGPVDALLRRIKPGARHSANWMLLRAACDLRQGRPLASMLAAAEGRMALARYARRGLICDRPHVRSLAYHSFCGALLSDIWEQRRLRWAGRSALRAALFLAGLILPNGDTLYLGRGQQQIFGYGALLYLLEAAEAMTGRGEFRVHADIVFDKLMRYQRRDGSFPLVLREGEEQEPWRPEVARPGWYSYNRYADYLPFLGCMLLKTAAAEAAECEAVIKGAHPDFRVVGNGSYTAVLARPGGAPTNDMAFPYVCVEGESLFPCYGREGDGLEPGEMPFPYGVLMNGKSYSFRDNLRYKLRDSLLLGESRLARHERKFEFREDGFDCIDEITFKQGCSFTSFVPANFLFRTLRSVGEGRFETWHRKARAVLSLEPVGTIYPEAAVTASGQLVALRHEIKGFEAKAGEKVKVGLRVGFYQ